MDSEFRRQVPTEREGEREGERGREKGKEEVERSKCEHDHIHPRGVQECTRTWTGQSIPINEGKTCQQGLEPETQCCYLL